MKLNLGCGPVQPLGWINTDGSMRAWLATRLPWLDRLFVTAGLLPATEFSSQTVFVALNKPLPWPTGSASCVYMGEVLEHFSHEDGDRLLAECVRVLAPGGILRLRVPDNERFWRNYLTELDATKGQPRSAWTDAHSRWVTMFFEDICVRRPWLRSMGHFHKWQFDEVSLVLACERHGLVEVERKPYQQSAIPDVALVEVRDDLIVEGRKP